LSIQHDDTSAQASNVHSFEGLENIYFISKFVQRNQTLMKIAFQLEV